MPVPAALPHGRAPTDPERGILGPCPDPHRRRTSSPSGTCAGGGCCRERCAASSPCWRPPPQGHRGRRRAAPARHRGVHLAQPPARRHTRRARPRGAGTVDGADTADPAGLAVTTRPRRARRPHTTIPTRPDPWPAALAETGPSLALDDAGFLPPGLARPASVAGEFRTYVLPQPAPKPRGPTHLPHLLFIDPLLQTPPQRNQRRVEHGQQTAAGRGRPHTFA